MCAMFLLMLLRIPNPAKAVAHKVRSYTDAMANPQALASSR